MLRTLMFRHILVNHRATSPEGNVHYSELTSVQEGHDLAVPANNLMKKVPKFHSTDSWTDNLQSTMKR